MALSIEDQFDLKHLERFNPFLGKKVIVKSGLFLDGLDGFIAKDRDISVRVLRTIELGRADIFNQERVFEWIDKLHLLVHKNNQSDISKAFFASMQALHEKTDIRFKRRGYQSSLNKEEASEYYGFGGSSSGISYGLRNVRFIANREAYKHFGYKYRLDRQNHIVDFPARLRIYIKNPKNKTYSEEFEGCYEGGATVSKVNQNLWELNFDNYFLSKHHEYLWNLNLWLKIFAAIQPVLSEIFDSEITYTRENQFND